MQIGKKKSTDYKGSHKYIFKQAFNQVKKNLLDISHSLRITLLSRLLAKIDVKLGSR